MHGDGVLPLSIRRAVCIRFEANDDGMNAEVMNLVLSTVTLVVVAAAAVAAIVQLRHLRASNQLNALLAILDQWSQPTVRAAYVEFSRRMPEKLADPEYVAALRAPGSLDRGTYPEFLVFDLWEQVGTYAKHGLIDESILLDITSSQVSNAWKLAAPVVAIVRATHGPSSFENFEYLAVRSDLWTKRYPNGTYPAGLPRMPQLGK